MSAKDRHKINISQQEIDKLVTAQAGDDLAWDKPVKVTRKSPASVSIPAELAARASFLARVHHTTSLDEWLRRVIQERVELEEAAFASAKQSLSQNTG